MSLVSLIIVLVIVGVLVWLINRAPFIDPMWKQVINYAALFFVIIWLLNVFGLLGSIQAVRVGG